MRALLQPISRRRIRCFGCRSVSFIVQRSLAKRTLAAGVACSLRVSKLGFLHTIDCNCKHPSLTQLPAMSLVSGPGRAGGGAVPAEMQLSVDKHVRYIQSLDTVRAILNELHATTERSPR